MKLLDVSLALRRQLIPDPTSRIEDEMQRQHLHTSLPNFDDDTT